jgi:hypothetical protein
MTVKIDDPYYPNSPQYSFNIIVTANTAPVFVSTLVSQSTPSGVQKTYTLPGTFDAESSPVTIGLTGGPNFVSLT